jgi:trans-2-enoyl-CoA reductase
VLVEKLKGYGAHIVVTDEYANKHEFKALIADLPKPKLALNMVGGETATNMARLLAYVEWMRGAEVLLCFSTQMQC